MEIICLSSCLFFYLFIIYLSNRTHIPGFYMLVEHKESFESVLPTSKVDLLCFKKYSVACSCWFSLKPFTKA